MRFIANAFRWIFGAALLLLVGGFLLGPATGRADQPVVTPTTQWVNFVSTGSTFLRRTLIVGDRVDIYDAQGALCGSRILSAAGALPVTPCYGDDPSTPEDEGAEPGGEVIFLPLIARYSGVDLVVESLAVQGDEVWIVLRNLGNWPVVDEFWVDLYIDPGKLPATVNQSWYDLGRWGAVWGVTEDALPLAVGQRMTLRLSSQGPYFYPDYSVLPASLLPGQSLYAQVDSYNEITGYGGVLESHESANQNSSGGKNEGYNNISDAFVLPVRVYLRAYQPPANRPARVFIGGTEFHSQSRVDG